MVMPHMRRHPTTGELYESGDAIDDDPVLNDLSSVFGRPMPEAEVPLQCNRSPDTGLPIVP
jgi:hypothetical protein